MRAHLFDPVLAVHTSVVDPLPQQITAVYESMLHTQASAARARAVVMEIERSLGFEPVDRELEKPPLYANVLPRVTTALPIYQQAVGELMDP